MTADTHDILDGRALAADPRLRRALLDLNNAHAVELSLLDAARFDRLVANAFSCECVGAGRALLLAFDQAADYDGENFRWFRERYARFVYVDRVVIADSLRGRGIARGLYARLAARALDAGHDRLVCEVNVDPPNAASSAFHASLGFEPVGSARLANGKGVQYLRKFIAPERVDG
jgi:predicted GNAT superfamily acetyltransferase